jgi:hypothetical protein
LCATEFPREQRGKFRRHVVECSTRFEGEIAADAELIANEPLDQYDREARQWGLAREADGKTGFKGGLPT